MIKIFLVSLSLLIFNACSFKTPPNQWQYQSSNAFNSYTKNFLESNEALAKNDLSRSIKHAKKSADLTMLARVYLGECALNISVGIKDRCKSYTGISDVVKDEGLDAYYNFITLQNIKPKNLDAKYKNFASYINNSQFKKAQLELSNINSVNSKLLCASLIKEHLDSSSREEMIKTASFHGYKKSVLFWLNEEKEKTRDEEKRIILSKKIKIMSLKN
ncbi:hypothetical protein [Sulfurimonas sp.]|uniref:hypothetical protein n=1 Tax=Sulfurimonas sp. TaxID=2022749 RepID=UPI002AAF807D|nr:hypothetical protein [Sulfurimonas sp.]